MARVNTVIEPAPPDLAPEPLDEAAEIAIRNALGQLNDTGDTFVTVHRIERGREAYLDQIPAAEFSIEEIKRRFGGGDFKCRVYVPQVENPRLRQLAANRRISIEGAPIMLDPPSPVSRAPEISQLEIMRVMQEGFTRMVEAIKVQAPAVPQVSESERMQTLVALMAAVKNMMPAPAQQSDPMTLFTTALSLAKEIQPRESEVTEMEVLMKAIESLGPAVVEVMKGGAHPAPVPAPAPVALPPPVTGAAPAPKPASLAVPQKPAPVPAPPSTPPENSDMMMLALKPFMGLLLNQAQADNDPDVYAVVIVDNVPPQYWPALLKRMENPDWFDQLVALDSRVAKYREWFTGLRDSLLGELTREESGADNPPHADGADDTDPVTGDS